MGTNRILLVEDDADNQEMVCFLLERAGYNVITANNGREALAAIQQQQPPDLILLDLSLPDLDGWAVARQLKAAPESQHIPLVALTAHTLPGDRRKALSAGCDGYIAKPMKVATFVEDIRKYLRVALEDKT